jgi:hypothetical protein
LDFGLRFFVTCPASRSADAPVTLTGKNNTFARVDLINLKAVSLTSKGMQLIQNPKSSIQNWLTLALFYEMEKQAIASLKSNVHYKNPEIHIT